MASRWKRVDLLRLSSVTSAAAGRRQQPPPRSAPLSSSGSLVGRAGGAVAAADACSVTVHGSTSPATFTAPVGTRVSVSRLLCGSSLPWQSALCCFHELAEAERRRRTAAAAAGAAGAAASASTPTVSRGAPTQRAGGDDDVLPLGATVSMYGLLHRQGGHRATQLDFLAYASRQHSSLLPIAALLDAGKGGGGTDPADCAAREAQHLPHVLSLLNLATLLHLGLRDVLQLPIRAAAVPAAVAPVPPPPPPSAVQRWAAVQTIYDVQHYGWGAQYLDAVATASALPGTPEESGGVPVADDRCDTISLVRCAALATPRYTHVLRTLEEAWLQRHASQLSPAASPQPPQPQEPEPEPVAGDWGGCAAVSGAEAAAPGDGTAVAAARVDTGDAAVAMVRALGLGAAPMLECRSAASDAPPAEIAQALPTVTRDVVVFAWRAMQMRRQRGGTPDAEGMEEDRALLHVVGAATQSATYEELRTWMEQLLPADDDPALVLSGPPTAPPPLRLVSSAQETALLRLLTRAVQRAPSWAAVCAVVSDTWRRWPSVSTGAADAVAAWADGEEERGAWRCRRQDGVASAPPLLEAVMASRHAPSVVPAALAPPAEHRRSAAAAEFWYAVCVCADTAGAPEAVAAVARQQQEWCELLFGTDTPTRSPAATRTADMVRRHEALTRVALLVVRCWLRPAQALEVVLQCLARSHARCGELWAAVLQADRSRSNAAATVAETLTAPAAGGDDDDRLADSALAAVVRLMADQHSTYCGELLSARERHDWLDAVLRCTSRGLARQLVLRGAWVARWRGGPTSPCSCVDDEDVLERHAGRQSAADALAAVVDTWVTAETATPREAALAALFAGGGVTPPARWQTGTISSVGPLLEDVRRAFLLEEGGSSATEEVFARARAAVTKAGLRLGLAVPVEVAGTDVASRVARLRGWVELLCTSPTPFLGHEHSIVVWLYVVMRLMEGLHEDAESGRTRQRSLAASAHVESPVWGVEEEAAVVRRVAQSLSGPLWAELPPSSLLPPMLLNWLLSRGGERDWGDAVRTLRAAALSESSQAEQRFSRLVLPLDHVVSLEHAVRVLRTLQLVEQRCITTPASPGAARGCGEASAAPAPAPVLSAEGGDGAVADVACAARHAAAAGDDRTSSTVDSELLDVYGRIERVLLREWYGRALAAVLTFLAKHPEHTYLTDAPGDAQRQPEALPRHGIPVGERVDTHAGAQVASQRTTDAPRRAAQLQQAPPPAERDAQSHPPPPPDVVPTCAAQSELSVETWREWLRVAAAGPSQGCLATGHPLPLHLVATFILQECRVAASHDGSSPNTDSGPHAWQSARLAAHSTTRLSRRSSSLVSAVASLDLLLGRSRRQRDVADGGGGGGAGGGDPPPLSRAPPPATVHPELLGLYLRVLRAKRSEPGRSPATTLEDVAAGVLIARCAEEVTLEEDAATAAREQRP
ncbi:hypothetical protein NESM_000229700 [Novymonas esmeraldas]|uniref:Uncharacterized protein n=1 Tax=Novymonas esmeraldas TaxID=1808958 RepID=A0AAW0F7I5_9TRYP